MKKNLIRDEILKQRQSILEIDVISKSNIIIKALLDTDFYKSSRVIMTYVSFRNEVKTKNFIVEALKTHRIIIPMSILETKEIELSELKNYDQELSVGAYGILEPKKEFARTVSHGIIDLVIVPGAAFDVEGNRIGYGAGYYDKFLSKLDKSVPKVALAFDFQIIENVPAHEYDVPMDYIITENRVIECKKNME